MKNKKTLFVLLMALAIMTICPGLMQAQVDNYALSLESRGRVSLGALSELDGQKKWTIQFWMCPDRWMAGANILTRGEGLKVQMGSVGALQVTVGSKEYTFEDDALGSGRWTHVTLCSNISSLKCYINNGTAMSQSCGVALATTDEPLLVGGGYAGRIDELRIWDMTLPDKYERHYRNTVNHLHPNWNNLVAYYKFDQSGETHIVDYKEAHHGTASPIGVSKVLATDNGQFAYKKHIAYTNFERFADRGIERDKYLQSNMLVILGPQLSGAGQIGIPFQHNDATVTGGTFVASEDGREGVLLLDGSGRLTCGKNTLCPLTWGGSNNGVAFASWVKLTEWTQGAFLVRKESTYLNGFSVRLGETEGQIIARINGAEFVCDDALTVGRWCYVGVSANAVTGAMALSIDGKAGAWTSSGTPTSWDVTATTANCYIGQGIVGYLDNVITMTKAQGAGALNGYMTSVPVPAVGGVVQLWPYEQMDAYYTFDEADKLGYDTWNYTESVRRMKAAYDGYRGRKILISLGAQYANRGSWPGYMDTDQERTQIATQMKDLMDEIGADGIDLDLEWIDNYNSNWTNYGKLCQAIRQAIGEDKTLTISPHSSYWTFPVEYMRYVDYFFFQNYGPQAALYSMDHFRSVYNTYINYGYPKEKIVMSFATTTSTGVVETGGTNTEHGYREFYTKVSASDNTIPGLSGSVSFTGVNQTYDRASYVREQDAAGIFYWDMGNDVPSTADAKSLVRSAAMAISSNLDHDFVISASAAAPTDYEEMLTAVPEEGHFYRFRNDGTGRFLAYADGSYGWEDTAAPTAQSVFYYDEGKLQLVTDGLFLSHNGTQDYQTHAITADQTGRGITFSEALRGTPGCINIMVGPYTNNRYLYQNFTLGNANNAGNTTADWANGYDWTAEEVTDLDIYELRITGAEEGQTVTYGDKAYADGRFIAVAAGTSTTDILADLGTDCPGYVVSCSVDGKARTITVTYKAKLMAGICFRLRNVGHAGYYMTANAERDKITACTVTSAGENAELRNIWMIEEADGGIFYLKNPYLDTYAGRTPTTGGWNGNGLDQPLTQTVSIAEAGTYAITETTDYVAFTCTNSGIQDDKQSLHATSDNRLVRWTSIADPSHWIVERVSTAIEDNIIRTDAEVPSMPAIYDLNGRKLPSLQAGINIVRYCNGRTAKVIVR